MRVWRDGCLELCKYNSFKNKRKERSGENPMQKVQRDIAEDPLEEDIITSNRPWVLG